MTSIRVALRSERGSALLISLTLVFVMTLLGLALFDLGIIENVLVLANQTDATAFEIAQAGLERGMDRMRRTIVLEERAGPALPEGPSWADGSTVGGVTTAICSPSCTAAQFNPVSSAYISNLSYGGGTYAISVKLLTVAEATAAPYSMRCRPQPIAGTDMCADIILLRSTGSINGPPAGYVANRTVQALVQAQSTSPLMGATANTFAAGGGRIAGTIDVLGDSGTIAWSGDVGRGQRNNWQGLANETLDRLIAPPTICPPNRTCPSGAVVESLGANLKIARPLDARALDINASVDFGTSGDSAAYGRGTAWNPTRVGKGPLDGVFIADGCVMPCTQNGTYVANDPASKGSFTTGSLSRLAVDGDNVTKPYPQNPPPAFPRLTDPAYIGGANYNRYACPAGSSCAGESDFFLSHAARLDNVTATGPCTGACPNLGNVFDNVGLTGATPDFVHTFNFTDAYGTALTGQMCWVTAAKTLTFGSPNCATPTQARKDTAAGRMGPVLIYFNSRFRIMSGGPIAYQGAAIILANDQVDLRTALVTKDFPAGCGAAAECTRKFPRHDVLAIMSPNNILSGQNADAQPIMGLFWVAPGGGTNPANPEFRSSFNSQTVGGVAAWRIDFAGGNVPAIYQAVTDARDIPEEFQIRPVSSGSSGSRWSVRFVPRFWKLCKPGAISATFGSGDTGPCSYR